MKGEKRLAQVKPPTLYMYLLNKCLICTIFKRANLQPPDFSDKKRPVLFGVDHDALHKQIEAYKREKGTRDSIIESPAAGRLTQEQLDMLADIRKQKLIEKKKQKSKRMKDDDISLKDFLLSRSLEKEEQDNDEDRLEESHISELMEEDDRRR